MNNTVEQLLIAKNRLITKGWTQGAMHDEFGYCALGAFNTDADAAVEYLQRVVGDDIARWNDAACRTVDDVFTAFDKAIELARSL